MLTRIRLTSTVLLSLALSASAGLVTRTTTPVTLALTKQFNLTGAAKMIEIDQARAKALKARTKASANRARQATPASFPLANQLVYYSTPVSVRILRVKRYGEAETRVVRLGLATLRRIVRICIVTGVSAF